MKKNTKRIELKHRAVYNKTEVSALRFVPYVLDSTKNMISVSIERMTDVDAAQTNQTPQWQTSWTSDYLTNARFEKYAAKVQDELVALAAYEILENALVVHIAYMEAQPESNPTMDMGKAKYTGIGQLMIAYGIKLSIDHGFAGDVVLEAKTSALAEHYAKDFGAVALPSFSASAPRFLIADDAAKRIFFRYLV